MSSLNQANYNRQGSLIAQRHASGILSTRRELAMVLFVLVLLAMGALLIGALLGWMSPGRVSADPMAPAFESIGSSGVDDGKSLTVPVPAGTANGDLLIAAVMHSDTHPIVGATAAWTEIDIGACGGTEGDSCSMGVWYRVADSEPASYDFTWTGSERGIGAIFRYSGVDPDNPINASSSTVGATGDPTAPALVTTVDETTILRIAGKGGFPWPGFPYPAGHTGL